MRRFEEQFAQSYLIRGADSLDSTSWVLVKDMTLEEAKQLAIDLGQQFLQRWRDNEQRTAVWDPGESELTAPSEAVRGLTLEVEELIRGRRVYDLWAKGLTGRVEALESALQAVTHAELMDREENRRLADRHEALLTSHEALLTRVENGRLTDRVEALERGRRAMNATDFGNLDGPYSHMPGPAAVGPNAPDNAGAGALAMGWGRPTYTGSGSGPSRDGKQVKGE